MFFLEYVIWGAWLPLLGLYMGNDYRNFTGLQQALVFNAFAIAALTGFFFGGQLADRYFSQEKFLAFSNLLGGLAILGCAYVKSFWPFFGLMLLHCFFYVPTLSITNAIAFANLKDAQKDFGFVRLWGTIGWIAAAWPFVFIPINWDKVPSMGQAGGFVQWLGTALSKEYLKSGPAMEAALTSTFIVAGVASLALAAFCFVLPHTPPAKEQGASFAPLVAMKLLAIPSIAVLFVVTFFDSVVHYCHFFWTSRYLKELGLAENWISPAMSIGQVMEIVAMATLGLFLKRLGWRTTMAIGILGQAVRFGVYSIATPDMLWLVIATNVVHGFAYACFFATVYIFVDENFPQDVRASAQSLFNLMILGIAQLVANFIWGPLGDLFTIEVVRDGTTIKAIQYHRLFLVPFGIAVFAAIFLAIFFHPPQKPAAITPDPLAEPIPEVA
jgi:nucleoside transporter